MPFENREKWLLSFFKACVVGVSLYYLVAYLFIALSRMNYPFELEWMEGGCLDHVRRVLEGKSLYVYPSFDFVPFIYTPFYFYVCAAFTKVWGLSFFTLRLVSFLSSLGIFFLIYLIIKKETNQRVYAFASVGLFAATFRLCGAWLDIARVDSLFLFLALLGFYLLLFHQNMLGLMGSALCFFLSFMTKQTALTIVIGPLLIAVIHQKKRGFLLLFLTSGLILLSTLYLNRLSEGWYWYYVYYLPGLHPWDPRFTWGFWRSDIGPHLFLSLLLCVGFSFGGSSLQSARKYYYFSFLIGCLGSSWLSRMHTGGYDNVLLMACLGISLIGGLVLASLEKKIFTVGKPFHSAALSFILALLLVQFFFLAYPLKKQIPTANDRKAGERFLETIRKMPESQIYIPCHPYYALMAGKEFSGAHGMALIDILRARDHNVKTFLIDRIHSDILKGKLPVVIFDWEGLHQSVDESFRPNYLFQQDLFKEGQPFIPVTGADFYPRFVVSLNLSH